MRVAARMCEALREPFVLSGATVSLSASAGVACVGGGTAYVPAAGASTPDGVPQTRAEALVRAADVAMYRSKEDGGGEPVLAAG